MNKLVESIIKPILGEQANIKKVIAIYPGRFQPFGPHHKAVYDYLKKKFDDVYIVTSNKQGLPRHPLNFKQKQAHMSKMGVPKSKISMEASPYIPKNLLKKFDPDTTALVFAVGKKDASRLSGGKYFKDYKKSNKDIVGYEEHGYVLIAPHISVKAGGMEVSGTAMRELLGSSKYKKDRERRFKKMFGYFDKKTFELMTTQFGKIFEDEVMIFKPTKMMKGKKKWFDGKGKEILFDLEEDITIPVKVGDTVLMGKWKNKKVKIKDIGVDKHGMPTINGKKATTFRIHNIVNIFDDEKTKNEILNKFLTTIDIKSIIEEASISGGGAPADDGPSYTYGNFRTYRWRNDKEAEKLGFKVVDYILKPEHKADKNYRTYPDGPVDSVSFFPAGIGTGGTPNNQTNLTGLKGYNRWKKHMKKLAQLVGYKLFNFIKDFKDEKRSIQIGSRETLKQQKEEELDEQTLTKEWWKILLTDVINPDTPVRYKDDKGNQKTVKFSSAIRYDTKTSGPKDFGKDHPAYKKAKAMQDKEAERKKKDTKSKSREEPVKKTKPVAVDKIKKDVNKLKTKHNPKEWTDANYREEAGEVLLNLPDQPLFKDKDTEEVVDFLKNNSEDRQLTTDEIKYMSNTEAGQTLKIMNDDSGDEDEFGDTDKTKRVKNLINYQNFEDPNRWNYTDKALAMFKEKGIRPPKYDDSGGDARLHGIKLFYTTDAKNDA